MKECSVISYSELHLFHARVPPFRFIATKITIQTNPSLTIHIRHSVGIRPHQLTSKHLVVTESFTNPFVDFFGGQWSLVDYESHYYELLFYEWRFVE